MKHARSPFGFEIQFDERSKRKESSRARAHGSFFRRSMPKFVVGFDSNIKLTRSPSEEKVASPSPRLFCEKVHAKIRFRIGFENDFAERSTRKCSFERDSKVFGFRSKLVFEERSTPKCIFERCHPFGHLKFLIPEIRKPDRGPKRKAGEQHCTGPRLPNGAVLALPRRHRSLSPLTAPLDARAHAFHACVMSKNG